MKVRVRFAPSPTGFLHLGGARTALFNFLFAKSQKGNFILRIEDTDVTREVAGAVEEIISSLRWLGLNWDEGPDIGGENGPYRQSQRLEIYQQKLEELKKKKFVYPCFCSSRKTSDSAQTTSCDCLKLSQNEVEQLSKTLPCAWRFKVPSGRIKWKDLIKGYIEVEASEFGDFVVMKSNGHPSFHFAVVVDDALMKITHVIRGEDHLTNTIFHLLLYQAFELSPPEFAHLPLLVDKDGSKLSKREESLSIGQLRKDGFLPEAILNYLALTGWSTGIEGKEVLTLDELIKFFSLDRVGKAPSIFDFSRLKWFNHEHLSRTPAERAQELLFSFDEPVWQKIVENPRFTDFFELVKENIFTLKDLEPYARVFLFGEIELTKEQWELIKLEPAQKILLELKNLIELEEEFKQETVNKIINRAKELAISFGQPVRLALKSLRLVLTAREEGPPLTEILLYYGKQRTLDILKKALED